MTPSGWTLAEDGKSISAVYVMKDFTAAMEFMGAIAREAEAMDHHPDLHLTSYRKLRIELSTHSIGGISDKDFALAEKINALPKKLRV